MDIEAVPPASKRARNKRGQFLVYYQGLENRVFRVTAEPAVLTWFAELGARGRGKLLEMARRGVKEGG
jgi:hypothetical protein